MHEPLENDDAVAVVDSPTNATCTCACTTPTSELDSIVIAAAKSSTSAETSAALNNPTTGG